MDSQAAQEIKSLISSPFDNLTRIVSNNEDNFHITNNEGIEAYILPQYWILLDMDSLNWCETWSLHLNDDLPSDNLSKLFSMNIKESAEIHL